MLTLILSLPSIKVGIFPLLAIFGSLQALLEYRKNIQWSTGKSLEKEIPFGQGLFSLIFSTLGSSIMIGILLGQPPTWLGNDGVLFTFVIVFLLQYVGDGICIKLCEQRILRRCIGLIDGLSYGFGITSFGVDLALSSARGKQSHTAAILCGILSGVGNQFLQETFHLYDKEWRYSTPTMLSKRHRWHLSSGIYTSIWISSIYYGGLRFDLIPRDTLKAILVISVGLYNFKNCLLADTRSSSYIIESERHSNLFPLMKPKENF
jgi:hypothetical protein